MTFKPTNVFCRLPEAAVSEAGDCLDAEQLRRALRIGSEGAEAEEEDCWTLALLLTDFAPSDIAVKLREHDFFVDATSESSRHAGDFTRVRRRLRLPEDADAESARCWMRDGVLVLQADWVLNKHQQQQQQQQQSCIMSPSRHQLVDVGACVVKDKSAPGAGRGCKWSLALPLPEFDADEVAVTKENGRVVIVAEHSAKSASGSGRLLLRRELTPPTGVQLELLSTRFADGVLRLEAPAPGLKPKRHSKIATLTRDLRSSGPHFQEKANCVVC